jgi:hypothetical protein
MSPHYKKCRPILLGSIYEGGEGGNCTAYTELTVNTLGLSYMTITL